MKKVLLFIFLLLSWPVLAARFLVTDPVDARATHCGIYIDTMPVVVVPVTPVTSAPAGNICQYDITAWLASAAQGTHSAAVTAMILDALGTTESPKSNAVDLTRPTPPNAPTGPRIVTTPRT